MGETAGWSSAAAATSSLAERADGRLSYLLTLTLHTYAEEKRVRVRPPEAERAQAGTGLNST